jgi:hypothetical protein
MIGNSVRRREQTENEAVHHAPGNSTTIEGQFDDWVRPIHS